MDALKEYVNQVQERDAVELMNNLPPHSIDLVVTDPPYEFISKRPVGGGFMDKGNKRHITKIKSSFGMSFDPLPMLKGIHRVCRKFNAYIFTNKTLLLDYLSFAKENKLNYDILFWVKRNPIPLFYEHYLLDKEYVIFLRERGAFFDSTLTYENYRTIYNGTIAINEYDHPTQKPFPLISKLIRISSKPNQIVLDPYLGTGTTAVAAEDIGRNWIGSDDDPKSCEIARKRLETERSKLRLPFILSPQESKPQELQSKGEQHELHFGRKGFGVSQAP